MVMSESEIRESNYHFRKAWQLFALVSRGAATSDRDGLSLDDASHPWFFMNFGFLNRPAASDSDLERSERLARPCEGDHPPYPESSE